MNFNKRNIGILALVLFLSFIGIAFLESYLYCQDIALVDTGFCSYPDWFLGINANDFFSFLTIISGFGSIILFGLYVHFNHIFIEDKNVSESSNEGRRR